MSHWVTRHTWATLELDLHKNMWLDQVYHKVLSLQCKKLKISHEMPTQITVMLCWTCNITAFFVYFKKPFILENKQERWVNSICNNSCSSSFNGWHEAEEGSDTLDLNFSSKCATLPHFHADICVCGSRSEERERRKREREREWKRSGRDSELVRNRDGELIIFYPLEIEELK